MEKLNHHEVTSENKDTAYIATVLLFKSVSQMALDKLGGWALAESFTSRDHCITEYRNGEMFIRAVSVKNYHRYSFGPIKS